MFMYGNEETSLHGESYLHLIRDKINKIVIEGKKGLVIDKRK